ncbi:hypothetical protein NHJ13734_009582 [Beauveria thailandica]
MISDEAAVIDNLDNQDISDQEFDDLMHSLEEDNADEQSDDETPALSKGKGKAKPKKEIEQGQRINGSGRLQGQSEGRRAESAWFRGSLGRIRRGSKGKAGDRNNNLAYTLGYLTDDKAATADSVGAAPAISSIVEANAAREAVL